MYMLTVFYQKQTEKIQTTHCLYFFLFCGFFSKPSSGLEYICAKCSPPLYIMGIWPRKTWSFCYMCCEMQFYTTTAVNFTLCSVSDVFWSRLIVSKKAMMINLSLNFIIYKVRKGAKSNQERILRQNSFTIQVIIKTQLRGSKSKYQHINFVDRYVFISHFYHVM